MRIAGIQKLTLLDFPGRCAATIFTPGCDLRCPFCHNASLVRVDPSTGCAPGCTPDEILDFLRKRFGKLTGLAITGGEPLMQEGLEDFMRQAKSIGYLVKLDTNGTYPERLKAIIEEGLADYVAMDIKNCDTSWAVTAGFSQVEDLSRIRPLLDKVHQSMDLLRSCGIDFEFRTTVVGGYHSEEDMEALGKALSAPLYSGAPAKPVEHYFLQNFVDSGDILVKDTQGCSKKTMERYLAIVRRYLPGAQLRGL